MHLNSYRHNSFAYVVELCDKNIKKNTELFYQTCVKNFQEEPLDSYKQNRLSNFEPGISRHQVH